jgi:hypothetical protein
MVFYVVPPRKMQVWWTMPVPWKMGRLNNKHFAMWNYRTESASVEPPLDWAVTGTAYRGVAVLVWQPEPAVLIL